MAQEAAQNARGIRIKEFSIIANNSKNTSPSGTTGPRLPAPYAGVFKMSSY